MGFFSSFFGDSELDNIDARINNVISNLPGTGSIVQSDNISGDFINEFIQQAPKTEIDRLLESVTVSRERLERYNVYDEAYKYVPIIKRILTVYISNILQKNPVTGKCLLVKDAEDLTGEKKADKDTLDKAKKFADDCIKSFGLLIKLRKKILPNKLVYGDCYVEVVNLVEEGKKKVDPNSSMSNITSAMPLFEAEISNIGKTIEQLKLQKDHNNGKITSNDQLESILKKLSEHFIDFQITPSSNVITEQDTPSTSPQDKSSPEPDTSNKNDEDEVIKYDDVLMKIHKPHRVIVLETDFGSLLGYLVVTKDEVPQTINLTQSLSTLVGRITTLHGLDQKSENTVVDKLVRYMLKTVLEKTQKSGQISKAQNIDQLLTGLPPDVTQYLKRLFVEQGLASKGTFYNRMRVRFVPSSDMIAFTVPSAEHDPYGQSFIDALIFPCKLYILSQLSNIIIKLSRAAPVRKWTLDIGRRACPLHQ
jgi:hypothetical protein